MNAALMLLGPPLVPISSGMTKSRFSALPINKTFFFIVLSSLYFARICLGGAYYVNPSHPQSNDQNGGSFDSPWNTIEKATKSVIAGDTVYVKSSYYNESVKTEISGTESNPIVFLADSNTSITRCRINSDHTIFSGFTCEGYTGYGSAGILQFGSTADFSSFRYCTADGGGTDRYGYAVVFELANRNRPSNCRLTNCTIKNFKGNNTYGTLVYLRGENNLIENCEFDSCTDVDVFLPYGSKHTIRNNYVHNILDDPEYGVHIDIFQIAIGGTSHDIVIENNRFENIKGALCQINDNGSFNARDWTFRNNVFYDITDKASVAIRTYWYNNTFVKCAQYEHTGSSDALMLVNHGTGDASGSIVRNCMFIDCGYEPTDPDLGWWSGEADVIADHNYVASGPSSNFSRKDSFVDANSVNGGDPQFMDYANLDFRLAEGSPAIDKGTSVAGFDYDILGNPRSNGTAWDIGAYESDHTSITELHNRHPSQPRLKYPQNGSSDIAVPVTFQWDPSFDQENDEIAYKLYICLDRSYYQCAPIIVYSDNTFAKASIGAFLMVLLLTNFFLLKRCGRVLVCVALSSVVLIGFINTCTKSSSSISSMDPLRNDELSYISYNLVSDTTYYWKVIAEDEHGLESESDTWSFSTR